MFTIFSKYGPRDSVQNYKAHLAEPTEIRNNENFQEKIINGDLNTDSSQGIFYFRSLPDLVFEQKKI